MSTPPVHHLRVRAFRYGTEVPERVDAAIRTVYPPLGDEGEPTIERTETEGHYGNPIEIYEAHLETAEQLRLVFDRLHEAGILEQLVDELEDRVTEDTELFLRFDKQAAYRDDELVLGDGIELRAKVEAYPATREGAIANLEAYLADAIA